MEKILLAMEGNRQNTYTIDFACYLAKLTGSRLIGAFLEGEADGNVGEVVHEGAGEGDAITRQVRLFREACVCREVPARVHRDRGAPLGEILLESRFADLIVVDPETSFKRVEREFPGKWVRAALVAAACPVVVSPYRFHGMDKVIFAYNGTASSVFAIKQFTYLFPEFRSKKAVVVSVRHAGEAALEEQYKIKEWFSAHYEDVEYVVLGGDASDELFFYLLDKKNAIVVLGSYGRGTLSRFFKPSQAGILLKTVNLPIFIAHR
ncbi:MAG: universal stress protein [Bacteroidetes bacterium]|nr:universal stress protein [Bacteroidota bacterium]